MIIVQIIGGLGNQMFQYAFGLSLAKLMQTECKLDITGFEKYKLHQYSLQHLTLQPAIASAEEIERLARRTTLDSLVERLERFHLLPYSYLKKYLRERGFPFDPNLFNLTGDHYLEGYWQTEKYYAGNENFIRQSMSIGTPPDQANTAMLQKIDASEGVSIHIRHGDYVSNKKTQSVHGVMPLEYYQRGIAFLRERLQDPTFYVFSDDIPWAKENLPSDIKLVFADQNDASKNYEDIRLMSHCKHHIIANSSFSWWGAWLNPNPDKIVIAPKQWFSNAPHDTRDLVPERWVKL